MYFLVADEAVHQQSDPSKFFIFGGIILATEKIPALTNGVETIRIKYGFKPDSSLKFSPNDRPKNISRENFLLAKRDILELAITHGVRFIGYAVLHAIARTREPKEIIEWGADSLLTKFQQFLVENDDSPGIAMFDTLPIPHPNKYLRRAFQLRMEHLTAGHRLQNINMICSVTDGCSHLTSICDICVGSFRFAVNEPDKDIVGKELMVKLKRLFWVERADGKIYPFDRGILLRPENVAWPAYAADYAELRQRLLDWMNSNVSRAPE